MTNEADTVKVELLVEKAFNSGGREIGGPLWRELSVEERWRLVRMFQAGANAARRLPHEAEGKVDAAKWIGPYSTAADALDGLRRAVAEEIGEDPETWPAHGNAPLAIAATIALLRRPASPQAVRAGVIAPSDEVANPKRKHGYTVNLTAEEMDALEKLAEEHQLKPWRVLLQGLRLYQLQAHPIDLGPMMAPNDVADLSASPSSILDPGMATTWKAVRDAIEICAGQMPGEYSLYTPAKACEAALEWTKFLEFAGAAAPKVLPGDDAMRLTWGPTSLPKFYLTITEEGDASVLAAREALASLKGVAATHRHKKRGTEYVLIGYGKMQAGKWIDPIPPHGLGHPRVDLREVAVYRSATDPTEIWVRPREEFEDGRFEALKDKP